MASPGQISGTLYQVPGQAQRNIRMEHEHLRKDWRVKTTYAVSRFAIRHYVKGARKFRRWTAKLLMPRPRGPAVVETLYGFKLLVDPGVGKDLESAVYYFGSYEAGTLHIINHCLRKGDTFIDVGSNIGVMSLFAAQLVGESGRVYAFEPAPDTFSILRENLRLNGDKTVQPANLALGKEPSEGILFRKPDINRGAASLIRSSASDEGVKIRVETLDNFIASNQVGALRLMKIDVEGWELEVMQGARKLLSRPDAPIVVFETSKHVSASETKVLSTYQYILSLNQYLPFKLKSGKEVISRLIPVKNEADLPDHDNLFCFLPAHLKTLPREIFAR